MKIKALLIISSSAVIILTALSCVYYYKKSDQANADRKRYETMYRKRSDLFENGPTTLGATIFLGDSQTQRFEISEYTKVQIKNRGIDGDDTKGVLKRLTEISRHKPKKVFLEIGINDILQKTPTDTTISNIKAIFSKLHADNPGANLYFISIFPVHKESEPEIKASVFTINSQISTFCKSNNIVYIDLFSDFQLNSYLNPIYDCGDKLHLNGRAYKIWADKTSKFF